MVNKGYSIGDIIFLAFSSPWIKYQNFAILTEKYSIYIFIDLIILRYFYVDKRCTAKKAKRTILVTSDGMITFSELFTHPVTFFPVLSILRDDSDIGIDY